MNKHEKYIRICYQMAKEAGVNGNLPFGAILVHNEKIIMRATNSVISDDDSTKHAELNLIVASQRGLPLDIIKGSTLYASTAPCLMCTSVIWNAGIRKIVYGVSYKTYANTIPGKERYIKCEEIYKQLKTEVEIIEGVLEDEGIKVYEYWPIHP